MKVQSFQKLMLSAAILTASLTLSSAFADGNQALKIRFVGGFVQNILQLQVDMAGVPTGEVEPRSMALVKGKGTFGPVDGIAISVSGPPLSDQSCSDGLIKVADILENNIVLTFKDLSMLYGNGTGVVCLDPADPTAFPVAEIDGEWGGGAGRFEGAEGDWSLRFGVAEPVGVTTQFIAETGVITGHVTRHHDQD